MEKQNGNHNGFGNGFLLGILVGVCLTLLFVTKKGRKLLKLLTEEGMDNVAQIRSRLEKMQTLKDDDLEFEEEEIMVPVSKEVEVKKVPVHTNGNGVKKASPKKFFRGILKKQ